ncbi:MAG TPA: hypothetical protein VFH85_03070 [Gammaproteobacteria bacterium]|nr:hypothetical protein [Gammaproteobacteria bacterium]
MDANAKNAILRAAVAAPSADNSQPWLFHWEEDTLDLGIDPSRSGGVSDGRYVLSDLAVGACLENMLIRGRSLGHEADMRFFATDADLWPVRLAWRSTDTRDAPLAAAIDARHTDRRFPWRGPVGMDVHQRLAEQADRDGVQLHWLNDKATRAQALAILRRAEALRFKSPLLHAELFSSVRFDVGWRATAAEGLPPAALAVEAPMRPVFQALRNPRLMAAMNRVGAASMLGFRSSVMPVRLAPALCLLSVAGTSRRDIINVGRALERVWLQATCEGLAVQPFAAAGVLALGFCKIEPRLNAEIAALQSAMHALCPGAHCVMFLRMGRARSPVRWRSGRRTGVQGQVSASFTV